jgi:cytidine deaminase
MFRQKKLDFPGHFNYICLCQTHSPFMLRKKTDFASLLKAAAESSYAAYAPYSNYKVGAAALCADDSVSTGCNVENASYGLSICAERVAVVSAVAEGKGSFDALAIVVQSGSGTAETEQMPSPCGACRQFLSEFCGPEFPVVTAISSDLGAYTQTTLGHLLPDPFSID